MELFVSLAEVEVEGLDASQLAGGAASSEHPVAPLLAREPLRCGHHSADPDGVVRAVPHLVSYRSREGARHVLPSLPLAAAMRLAETRAGCATRTAGCTWGSATPSPWTSPATAWCAGTRRGGAGSRGSVSRAIPAWNVLLNLFAVREGVPPRAVHDIEGRVIVFTNTSRQAMDFQPTPIGEETPAGAVLAQSLVNLLQSEGLTRATPRMDLFLTLGLAFIGAFLALTFNRGLRSVGDVLMYLSAMGAVGLLYAGVAWYVFVNKLLWVAMAGPLLAMGLTFIFTIVQASRTERQIRHFINDVLGRYVSPEVARLVTRDLRLLTRPERREVTVFFSDIEGFTRCRGSCRPSGRPAAQRVPDGDDGRGARHAGRWTSTSATR